MTEVKMLDSSNHVSIRALAKKVESKLIDESWFIPMPEEALENMFASDSTLTVCGAFVDGVLAAIALIDTDPAEMADLSEAMSLPTDAAAAELGACMVLPEYRGNNLMHLVCQRLVAEAKEMGLAFLVASAHPDNAASNKSLKKLGMEHRTTLIRGNSYLRNAYCLLLGE